jgi:steroid delta-isomerase-like uncharacterized protein
MERDELLQQADDLVAAWNRGDADGVAAFYRDDSEFRDIAAPEVGHGPQGARDAAQAYMTAFPDLHIEVRGVVADGDRIAQEWTATGTNNCELMGLEPTGRHIDVLGCTVATFNPDLTVRESQLYWDVAGLMRQLGPAVAAASTSA